MGIGQTAARNRLFLIWLAATVLWAAAATAFFPLRDAASAIWRNAPNAAEQVSMFNVADKSFSLCMQQRPPAAKEADIPPDRARLEHCTSLKDFLYGQTVGMPRDTAWGHVGRFAAATFAGALGIAGLTLTASWLARRFNRAERQRSRKKTNDRQSP
jgi:hypothetical protein